MDYQVWTKEEFGDVYKKVDCGDLGAVKRELDKAVRAGTDPILTVEVLYSLAIKVEDVGTEEPKRKVAAKEQKTETKEESKSETDQSEAAAGESPGAEGKGKV